MKPAFLFALLIAASLNASELSFGSAPTVVQDGYIIQLLSTKSYDGAQATLKKVPQKYQSGMNIEQNNGFYGVRYITATDKQQLPKIISDFKAAGFQSPLPLRANTLKTTTLPPKNVSTKTPTSSILAPPTSPKETPKHATTPTQPSKLSVESLSPKLSEHDQTRLILDATNAQQQHDYTQATIYYEMMVAAGMKDRQILINLAYLYGREGSFSLLEKKIEGKRGINDYLYAYGVGALEAGRSDLYNALSPYLIYDKSGKLSMLCGYFFEQENDPKRAAAFYKIGYDHAPSDPHILYAYARSVDIAGDKEKALYLYTQLSQLGANFEPLRVASQSRIQVLRSIQ